MMRDPLSIPSRRKIVETTVRCRQYKPGIVYLGGAVSRICVELDRRAPFADTEALIDAIEECVAAEEKHIEWNADFFEAVALPGWFAWSECSREMI